MNCAICRRDCTSDFVTADCTYHYLCSTCTAVFLDGLSPVPPCHRCYAKHVYETFTKSENTRKPGAQVQHLKLSPKKLTGNRDEVESIKPPSLNTIEPLTPTSTENISPLSYSKLVSERNRSEKQVKSTLSNDVPFTQERGSVSYKVDMFTGKMVRLFPYMPKKIKNTPEKIRKIFEETNPQTKEEITNDMALKMNIPSNSLSYSAEADMQYVDNLFSFLREEKSKRQKFAVPSIKSRYHPDELEFTTKKSKEDFDCFSSNNTLYSCKQDSRMKAPVMDTLLSQLQPEVGQDESTPVEEDESSECGYNEHPYSMKYHENYEMSLCILGRSLSPASDVKGEYGSEDDKRSISSGSGSSGLQNDQGERSHSGSESNQSVVPQTRKILQGNNKRVNGYNDQDQEEERCTSPCKGVKLGNQKGSLYWDERDPVEKETPTLPEPPAHRSVVISSSDEDDSAEIPTLCDSTATKTGIISHNKSLDYPLSESSDLNTMAASSKVSSFRNSSLTNVLEDDDFWGH